MSDLDRPDISSLHKIKRKHLMSIHQPKYSKEESARRGNEIYESQVRSLCLIILYN